MAIARETQQVAISHGHTFISYARHDSAFVTEVTAGLRARGVPIWIDQWDIEPGANWSASIDAALRACDNMLIVLSPEAVTSDEVLTELRSALNDRKRVIPLLHRECDIPTRLLLTQCLDWSRSTEVSEASLDELADLLRTSQTPYRPRRPDADRTGRRTLLDDVREEARDRLQSLGTETPIAILLERQPHQVLRPWDSEFVVASPRRAPPPAVDVLEVFDDAAVNGSLLILGAPGSGKTTVLVQLLHHLADRAEGEAGEPIPVLLSLASWNDEKPLDDWLIDELNVKYGVRRDVGRRWRDDGVIVPLLDALDEVAADHQPACVEAVNAFRKAYRPRHLVVSCRQAEYEHLPVKLRLREAVSLQPLEPVQIRTYLERAGSADLWNAIESDPEWLEMSRSPLLLSFISSMANQPSVASTPGADSGAERRRHLFDTYLATRLSATASPPAYSPQQTTRLLRQLATMLRRKGRSEFLIERMQPDWLVSRAERWSYRAGVLVVSAAAVLVVMQLLLALFGLFPPGNIGQALTQSQFSDLAIRGGAIDSTLSFLFPLIVGCVVAMRRTIVPIETLTWSWSRAATNALSWARTAAAAGLDYGTTIGVLAGLVWHLAMFRPDGEEVPVRQTAGQLTGFAGSVVVAILLARLKPAAWIRAPRQILTRPRTTDALVAAAVFAAVTGVTLMWLAGLLAGLAIFAVVGLSAASNGRDRIVLLRWPLAGAMIGGLVGAVSWSAMPPTATPLFWMTAWVSGALAVGMIAGLVRTLFSLVRDWRRATSPDHSAEANLAWKRLALTALLVGASLGVAVLVTARLAGDQPMKDVLVFVWFVQFGLVLSLAYMILGALTAAQAGAVMAGLLGGLAGALSGAKGADVERRLLPNQGVRQSATNVLVFSVLGTLIIGVPYGMFNLSVAAVMVQTLPTGGDWLRYCVGAGIGLGLLAGLLPGAACIQHFVLRFVLWAAGAAPLHFVRFLQFATERRLLQRVGGRYRFIHVSLRDHLADSFPARCA